MLNLKKYNSIHEIDAAEWNSILEDTDVFHRHRFMQLVEESKVENAKFSYLAFYDQQKLVATTVLSTFSISLDLFIGNSGFVKAIKKLFPNLFSIKILVCGLPASFGQSNLKWTDDRYAEELTQQIADEMYAMAAAKKIKFLAIKEFEKREAAVLKGFEQKGFFLANSIPYMYLDIGWNSFQDYLSALRHPYRRKILLSLKKAGHTEPVITPLENYDGNTDTAAWVLAEPGEDFAGDFFPKYLRIMERTPVKLETLNKAFFEKMQQQKGDYKVLHFIAKGKLLSTAVLVFSGDTLTFMLLGREDEKDAYDSYFNLVYGILALAIRRGIHKLKLGQTAYWVKKCIGGTAEDEFLYFASRRPLVHRLLKRFRAALFPATKLESLHVFHEKTGKTEMQNV